MNFFKALTILAPFAFALFSATAAEPGFSSAFAALADRTISDGRLIAPFYENHISPHVVVARETVFCAFQNSIGQPMVMAYQPGEKKWLGPAKASEAGLKSDDHGNPALLIDREGHLHVFYGCHRGPMRHARSERPYDIATWKEQAPPCPKATYPQVMRMSDGKVALFYRVGDHTEPWTMQMNDENCRTWGPPQRIIEMRLDPPDKLAAAYCFFFPGAQRKTIHVFWNHKDDNAARVKPTQPHPWRPLKYPGLHEAVYRYNVYYMRRDADGVWRNGAGEPVTLPVSRTEANKRCLVYDSGDEFTMLGTTRFAVDAKDQPYIRFGTGVQDSVRTTKDPNDKDAVLVPSSERYAAWLADGWRISRELPADWPGSVKRTVRAPGVAADSETWPEARWFISAHRRAIKPGLGCAVFLYNDETGFISREGGPASVE